MPSHAAPPPPTPDPAVDGARPGASPDATRSGMARLWLAAVACGLLAGCIGMAMALFIDMVEDVAFGRRISTGWAGVTGIGTLRVLVALTAGGFVAALVWTAVRPADGSTLPSVQKAVGGARLPLATVPDAVAQLVVVGTGTSVGREVAPRQVSAWASQFVADALRLAQRHRTVLVAAAAGAGLAAVYNVPLAGTVMAVEMLLRPNLRTRRGWQELLVCLVTSAVATVTAWPVVTRHSAYTAPHVPWSWLLALACAGLGIVCEPAARLFGTLTTRATRSASKRQHLWFSVPAASLLVGVIALWAPQVVGNGRPLVTLALERPVPALTLAGLALAKSVATPLSLRGGATGGLLTPSMAAGAALGACLCVLAEPSADAGTRGACALAGTVVLLGITQKAPLFAFAFIAELTRPDPAGLVMMALALAAGFGVQRLVAAALPAMHHPRPDRGTHQEPDALAPTADAPLP